MTGEMPNKTTTTKAGAKGATKVARNRTARRAAKPAAKATWFVGKRVAKRKARNTPAATATLPARRGPQRSSTGRWSRRCSEGSSNPSPGAGSRPSWPGSRSVAASCTSRSATGPLRARTRNGHDPTPREAASASGRVDCQGPDDPSCRRGLCHARNCHLATWRATPSSPTGSSRGLSSMSYEQYCAQRRGPDAQEWHETTSSPATDAAPPRAAVSRDAARSDSEQHLMSVRICKRASVALPVWVRRRDLAPLYSRRESVKLLLRLEVEDE